MAEAKEAKLGDDRSPSVIGAGITVTGNIEATDDLQVDGKVTGDVRSTTLVLGEGSLIVGKVLAERVHASGVVEGSIDTTDLALEATARVTGDVSYCRIRIANGGTIHGQMKLKTAGAEAQEAARLRLVEPKSEPKAKDKPGEVYID